MSKRCTLTDFCKTMGDMRGFDDHGKGIVSWNLMNIETAEWTRILVGYKPRANGKGIAFNYCPFCGFDYSPKLKSSYVRKASNKARGRSHE